MLRKKIFITTLLFIMTLPCYAVDADGEDWYLGVQAGYARSNYTRSTLDVTSIGGIFSADVKVETDGIGGRIYMGRKFNRFSAMELGYTRYNDVTVKNAYGVSGFNGRIKPQAVDLTALILLPITNQFHVYTRVGVAYLDVSATSSVAGVKASVEDDDFRPAYGLGAIYDISKNWSVDASWTRVHGEGGRLENSTLTAIGFSYHFN